MCVFLRVPSCSAVKSLKGVTALEHVCVSVQEALESLGVIGVRGSVFQHLSAGTGQ